MISTSSKGKKKNMEGFSGAGKARNIVMAELYDDMQEKIEQVKKVVRNRSKVDIALVLRSCEQADNAVDAAIAKLIGPDRGRECLEEWAIQSRKTKLKRKSDSSRASQIGVSKHSNRHNSSTQLNAGTITGAGMETVRMQSKEMGDEQTGDIATVAGIAATNAVSLERDIIPEESKDEGERKSRSKQRQPRHHKKKPRPPKRIRDKLKQLVPPEKQEETLFDFNTATAITVQALPEGQQRKKGNEVEITAGDTVPSRQVLTGRSSSSTSGVESGGSSTGTASPLDNSSPVRKPLLSSRNDVFGSNDQVSEQLSLPRPLVISSSNPPAIVSDIQSPLPLATSTTDSVQAESSLKKLSKDLHRCDISLSRYQNSLNEQCDLAIKNLQKVFTILRIGLSTREEDIYNELQTIRHSATDTLQRRKATCASLKKLTEFAHHFNDTQVQELKKQLKQFITERRIDEELGVARRFSADPDDLLPLVMKFGKTTGVQADYNSWNESPGEAIGKSVTANLPLLTPRGPPLIKTTPPLLLPPCPLKPQQQLPLPFVLPGFALPYPIPPHAILKTQSVFGKIPILPTPPIPKLRQVPVPMKDMPPPAIVEYTEDEFGRRRKYTPEQLLQIQERVKGSLEAQGVCLYNPYTGKVMKPDFSPSQDGGSLRLMAKKTPTQQRRERKKRQKEREKRQREQEEKTINKPKLSSEDVNNKVGRPATTVTIINRAGFKPWWSQKYNHYPHRRPHPHNATPRSGGNRTRALQGAAVKELTTNPLQTSEDGVVHDGEKERVDSIEKLSLEKQQKSITVETITDN